MDLDHWLPYNFEGEEIDIFEGRMCDNCGCSEWLLLFYRDTDDGLTENLIECVNCGQQVIEVDT